MSVDSDLVGVIVACTAVGVCLCVVVVLGSCVCHRRLEDKRRKAEKKRLNGVVGWPIYSPNAVPDGDTRIGDYRPRILSPNSPRSTATVYDVNSSRSSFNRVKGDISTNGNETPSHPQSPRRHHGQSSPPLYSNSFKANGHVLVPISVAAQHYRMVSAPGTQDFYDARATTIMPIRPYQSHEEFIETEYYPDVILDSPVKEQQQQNTELASSTQPPNGVATEVSSHNANGDVTDSPATQIDETDNGGKNEGEATKSNGINPVENESNHPEETAIEMDSKDTNQNSTETNGNGLQYKVIKKQHGHVKMPEWMVREYEEAESSIEVEEEAPTPAEGQIRETTGQGDHVTGMVSVMVGDYTDSNDTPRDRHQAQGSNAWNSTTVEEGSTSIIQDYSSTNYIKDFTILDYVDPPPPPPLPSLPPPLPSDLNEDDDDTIPTSPREKIIIDDNNTTNNSNNVNDSQENDSDQAIKERKAAVLRQIRQKVNESAEKMPPAFTSTPRVDPNEIPVEPLPPPPPPPLPLPPGVEEDSTVRRQRNQNEGSLDELPPLIGDTRL